MHLFPLMFRNGVRDEILFQNNQRYGVHHLVFGNECNGFKPRGIASGDGIRRTWGLFSGHKIGG